MPTVTAIERGASCSRSVSFPYIKLDFSFEPGRIIGHPAPALSGYAEGSSFEGQFANAKPAGKGVRRYLDGSRYTGNFIDNRREGRGVLESADNIISNGSAGSRIKGTINAVRFCMSTATVYSPFNRRRYIRGGDRG